MILPDPIRIAVEETVSNRLGAPTRVISGRPLAGGSIHRALEVTTTAGPLFLKWNLGEAGLGFGAEARGLEALRTATRTDGMLRVPRVVGWRDADGAGPGWLALEYLPPSREPGDWAERLGCALAELHAPVRARWGWPESNRIGPLEQHNPGSDDWGTFWRDARLAPLVTRAAERGSLRPGDHGLLGRVLDTTADVLDGIGHDDVSLVHGDFWSGNVHPAPDRRAVFVDPAAYHGHREVDLAMAELFGGIPVRALDAYREARPLRDGYERRRPLYQLYYLLAHLNLFGSGYLPSVRRAARLVLRRMG